MIESILTLLFFGFAYALKGGSVPVVSPYLKKIEDKNKLLEWVVGGKSVSAFLVFVFSFLFLAQKDFIGLSADFGVPEYFVDTATCFFITLAWVVAVSLSMGEEHGAVGDYKGALPVYLDRAITKRGRMYDVKKALQRGVWMGAAFAFATGNVLFIPVSLLFIPTIWIGQSLNLLILRKHGWTIAEPIVGAFTIGLGFII